LTSIINIASITIWCTI